jgi:hypothetical protein
MSIVGFGSVPTATLIASSDSSGGPSHLVIALVAIGVIWVASYFAGSGATVVVVERPGSFLATLLVIVIGLGLFYVLFLAPVGSF